MEFKPILLASTCQFCLTGATSPPSYSIILLTRGWLSRPLPHWVSKLYKLLAQRENLLIPDNWTGLFYSLAVKEMKSGRSLLCHSVFMSLFVQVFPDLFCFLFLQCNCFFALPEMIFEFFSVSFVFQSSGQLLLVSWKVTLEFSNLLLIYN